MSEKRLTVSIPASLHREIEAAAKASGDASVEAFVEKALRSALSGARAADEVFSSEDEEKVKERLKALGYID